MSRDPDYDIRALESRLKNNVYQLERLSGLCSATLHRIAESTSAHEIGELRGDLAIYRHEIEGYARESAEIVSELGTLRRAESA